MQTDCLKGSIPLYSTNEPKTMGYLLLINTHRHLLARYHGALVHWLEYRSFTAGKRDRYSYASPTCFCRRIPAFGLLIRNARVRLLPEAPSISYASDDGFHTPTLPTDFGPDASNVRYRVRLSTGSPTILSPLVDLVCSLRRKRSLFDSGRRRQLNTRAEGLRHRPCEGLMFRFDS